MRCPQKDKRNVMKQYPPVIPKTPKYFPNKTVDKQQRIPPTIEFIKKGSCLWHLR